MNKFELKVPYRDLPKMGYTFQKLYASNYRCYHKELSPGGHHIWIWVKGKDIEINDWYSKTYDRLKYIINVIENNTFKESTMFPGLTWINFLIKVEGRDLIYDQELYDRRLFANKGEEDYKLKTDYWDFTIEIEDFKKLLKELETICLPFTD